MTSHIHPFHETLSKVLQMAIPSLNKQFNNIRITRSHVYYNMIYDTYDMTYCFILPYQTEHDSEYTIKLAVSSSQFRYFGDNPPEFKLIDEVADHMYASIKNIEEQLQLYRSKNMAMLNVKHEKEVIRDFCKWIIRGSKIPKPEKRKIRTWKTEW